MDGYPPRSGERGYGATDLDKDRKAGYLVRSARNRPRGEPP